MFGVNSTPFRCKVVQMLGNTHLGVMPWCNLFLLYVGVCMHHHWCNQAACGDTACGDLAHLN